MGNDESSKTYSHRGVYMIENKNDLHEYLEADKKSLGRNRLHPEMHDIIWKYEIVLRKKEYYYNTKDSGGIINKVLNYYYSRRLFVLGVKCGFSIGLNCCDRGLALAHRGTVIINGTARIGKNARIHADVNIGTSAGKKADAPTIGDNVYIGPGAKIFGKIIIGNNVAIGANAVVNKSFEDDNISIAGVPAKVISKKGSDGFLIKGTE